VCVCVCVSNSACISLSLSLSDSPSEAATADSTHSRSAAHSVKRESTGAESSPGGGEPRKRLREAGRMEESEHAREREQGDGSPPMRASKRLAQAKLMTKEAETERGQEERGQERAAKLEDGVETATGGGEDTKTGVDDGLQKVSAEFMKTQPVGFTLQDAGVRTQA